MTDTKFTALARKLTALAVLVALMATVYAFGASTPQEAVASSHNVEYVSPNWSLKPSGVGRGQQFRLIFYSATKRDAESTNIEDYNSFVQDRAAAGHADIQPYSAGFRVVGCTEAVDARDNTGTTGTGVPIYWLNGTKVSDDYHDFYDGSWDNEANDRDRNEHGNTGPNSSLLANYPWTGCEQDGTEALFIEAGFPDISEALGNDEEQVRVGRPGSSTAGTGPLHSNVTEDWGDEHPMYGLSQVFTVLPGNPGTLTTGGTPRSDTLDSSEKVGHFYQVKLHENVPYQIDVKGSERSQPGGTIENPRITVLAGKSAIKHMNKKADGTSQTATETRATAGGIGQNSRLIVKPKETKYYFLLIHRANGDNGTYTASVNRIDYPQGRRAPDIFVDQENRNSVEITWTKPKKTYKHLSAPEDGYEIGYRVLSTETWSSFPGTSNSDQRTKTITGLARNTTYEVRVRMSTPTDRDNLTYQWGYARVYTTN